MFQRAKVRVYILDVPTSNLIWNAGYRDCRFLCYPQYLVQIQKGVLNHVICFYSGLHSLFTAIQSFSAV